MQGSSAPRDSRPDSQTAARRRSSGRSEGPGYEFGGRRLRVRVALGACLVASAPGIAGGAGGMALSVAVLLSALFAHELGHALSALAYGARATVVLSALGGHTEIDPRLSRRQELTTSLMGPLASIGIGGFLYWAHTLLPGHSWLPTAMRVNLAWGAMHLLPVLPFDGGKILLSTVGVARHGRVLWASGAIALMIATEALFIAHSALVFFVFGVATLSSLAAWAKLRRTQIEARLQLPERLTRSRLLLRQGKADGALELANSVTALARSNVTSNEAWHLVAWAELELGLGQEARASLQRVVPSYAVDSYCLAATEAALGSSRRAVSVLEGARAEGPLGVGATKLLIDSYARLGLWPRACAVTKEAFGLLDPADIRCVVQVAFVENAIVAATELAAGLFQLTCSVEDAALHAQGLSRLREREPGPPDTSGLRDSVV
jgi:Zn-dependent protease